MSLDDLRERFLSGIYGCSSIDCYLVRISSLIYDLEDLSRVSGGGSVDREYVVEFLRKILLDAQDKLQALACNLSSTISLIDNDPRYKNIRKYRDEFIDIINSIKCVEPVSLPVKNLTPPPSVYEPRVSGLEPVDYTRSWKKTRSWSLRPRLGVHWAALLISIFMFISLFLPWYEISYTLDSKTLASAGITPIGALKYYFQGDTREIDRFIQALPILNRTAAKIWALHFLNDLKPFIYMVIAAFITTGISIVYRKAGRITVLLYALILVGYPLLIAWNYGTEYLHTSSIGLFGIELSLGISWGYLILWAPTILYIIFKD